MAEADIPEHITPAIRWVIAGIALFVFFLIAAEKLNDGQYQLGLLNAGLFIFTFIVAVKWNSIISRLTRGTMNTVYIALAVIGALAFGIALGGLVSSRLYQTSAAQHEPTGRIIWNFDQAIRDGFFLTINRLNQEEERVISFGMHGKNTSIDPITEFSGFTRSDITNALKPIYLLAQDAPKSDKVDLMQNPMIPTLPEYTFGIPPLADFDITTHDKAIVESGVDGVPLSQFLREFGAFTVVLKYDGITVEKRFSKADVVSQIDRFEKFMNPPTGLPRVTRKPTAPPPPAPTFTIPPPAPIAK